MRYDNPERYRASMRRHRFGYALFEPDTYTRLKPGMLGFLDDKSLWHPILDLTDTAAVKAGGFTEFPTQRTPRPNECTWGPLTSSTVKGVNVNLTGNVDASSLGLPIDIGGAVKYSTDTDFGAILTCDNPVESIGFDFRGPFTTWIKGNTKALLASKEFGKDIRTHGVIAATWTYVTTDIYIQNWSGADQSVTLGFKLGTTGIGSVEPEVSWHRAHSSDGWRRWTDEKRVVFFTGVKIKYNIFGAHEQDERKWRGASQKEFFFPDIGNQQAAVGDVDNFGDDFKEIENDVKEKAARTGKAYARGKYLVTPEEQIYKTT